MEKEAVNTITSDCSGIHSPMEDTLRHGLYCYWKNKQFVDYTIKVDNHEFCVHKLIMSSMSDYFHAMLTGGMAETGKDHVVIEGISAEMVEILINFIYTNHMDINTDNAADILHGAIYFQINAAIKMCTSFMVKNLDPENWFDVITLFRSYALEDAVNDVEKYVQDNMRDVFKSVHVVQLPYEELCFLLQNWYGDEDSVFDIIQCWVKADLAERYKYYDNLLQQARFCLMITSTLLHIKDMKPISGTPNCLHSLISSALDYHRLPLHLRVLDESLQSTVRKAPSFLAFSTAGSTNGGYFYRPDSMIWTQHRHLKSSAPQGQLFSQVVVNNFLIVHTAKGLPLTEQWYIFDPRIVKWERMACLPRCGFFAVLTHSKTHLYAVGGENLRESHVFDEVDEYDFQADSWRTVSHLPVPLHAFGGCIYHNRLYVAGGVPEGYTDMTTETRSHMDCLDLFTGEWESRAPMLRPRLGRSMHAMKILGKDVLFFFEEWDFEYYSPTENQWSVLKFSFNQPAPQNTCKHWIQGNTVFTVDSSNPESRTFDREQDVCVVKFPKEGTEALVEYMPELNKHFNSAAITTVLSIAPYSCLLHWTHYQVES